MKNLFQIPADKEFKFAPEREYQCPKCKDVGYILEIREKPYVKDGETLQFPYEYAIWCDCRNGAIAKSLFETSGITPEFQEKTIKNFKTQGLDPIIAKMRDTAVNYYINFERIEKTQRNSIALLGQSGIGKTHLLMALCNNMITNKRKSVKYFPYVEGFDELRSDLDNLENNLNVLKNVDVLFIDDAFKPVSKQTKDGQRIKVPSASEWEIKQMYSIINYRHFHHKPIFISSELDFPGIMELDEALGSRIFEMCKDFYVHVEKNPHLNYRLIS